MTYIEGFEGGKILSVAALVLVAALTASCASTPVSGDFCDVSEQIHLDSYVAVQIVTLDRPSAVKIDAHNRYGKAYCGWK